MTRLNQIDANLLVALDILLEERHVTRAAQRLGVTQSAMSQTLQRLRASLDDPLLVRSGGKMVPTPRAEMMAGPLRAALRALDHTLVGESEFDPSQQKRNFLFSSLDTYSLNLIPALFERVSKASEGLSVEVIPLEVANIWEHLRSGAVELALIGPRDAPDDICTKAFFREEMVSVVRRDHPILQRDEIDLEAYTSWPHAVFRITGRGKFPIDIQLEELGYKRRIVGYSPYFLATPALVCNTDFIITTPKSAALEFAKRWPIELFKPPLRDIKYWIYLAWPNFLDADPGHLWLRELVYDLGKEVL